MNSWKTSLFILPLLLLVSNCLSANTYQFSIGGWSDGGNLNGQFETSLGAEFDSHITTLEIERIQANYIGTYNLNWTIDDIVYFGFGQVIDTTFQFGRDAAIGGEYIGSPSSFSLFRYVVGINNNEFAHTNDQMVIQEITAVPLPASIWLFSMGMLSLIGTARKRRITVYKIIKCGSTGAFLFMMEFRVRYYF